MTTIAPQHLHLRATLAAPQLRESLRSMVHRRVPRQDADDVLQAVLCDALAAQKVPDDAEEIMRWLMAIAKHKVADFHRRAGRERASSDLEVRSPFDPVEERDLLARVAASEASGSAGETLRWAVREWTGVPLSEIALEAELPAEVVRQRVSRLRRRLRAKWLVAALALLWVGSTARLFGRSEHPASVAEEVALTADDGTRHFDAARSAVAPLDLGGTWKMGEVVDDRKLTTAFKAFVVARAPLTSFEIANDSHTPAGMDRILVHSPVGDRQAFVRWTEKGNAWKGELRFGTSKGSIEVRRDGEGLLVTCDDGPFPGSARFVR